MYHRMYLGPGVLGEYGRSSEESRTVFENSHIMCSLLTFKKLRELNFEFDPPEVFHGFSYVLQGNAGTLLKNN
jgi:hypothetical protein